MDYSVEIVGTACEREDGFFFFFFPFRRCLEVGFPLDPTPHFIIPYSVGRLGAMQAKKSSSALEIFILFLINSLAINAETQNSETSDPQGG